MCSSTHKKAVVVAVYSSGCCSVELSDTEYTGKLGTSSFWAMSSEHSSTMNLRITLLLASALMLQIAGVLSAGLGEGCTGDDNNNNCEISYSTCNDSICVCQPSYHQEGSECIDDCTANSCNQGQICDLEGTKQCIQAQGCTASSCSADQTCLEEDVNTVCVQNCTESSCPAGHSCLEVEGNMVCVQTCTEDSCSAGDSCQAVQGSMVCVQNCTESSCPDGQSCLDVQGILACAEECISCPDGQSCQSVDGIMQCSGAAATTASVILLTVMTLMTFRFL